MNQFYDSNKSLVYQITICWIEKVSRNNYNFDQTKQDVIQSFGTKTLFQLYKVTLNVTIYNKKIMFNKYFDKYGYAEVQNKLKIGKIKGDV